MRGWRPNHPLNDDQKRKDVARSTAGVYKRRGKLTAKPCEACGDNHAEMHHDDYDKPLDVRWMCRTDHLRHHATRETFRGQS